MLILYVITIFLSAGLLFMVQPMFAKMVLPLLGGSPSVWNTCMVFFQATLLAGYGYAHLSRKLLGPRRQAMLHTFILLLPLLVLPLAVPEGWTPPAGGLPTGWLLLLLAVGVGAPFFVIASHAPMLQSWFAASGHVAAKDPYHLYAASNLGSMLALLAYPAIVEPVFGLEQQGRWWSIGYGVLVLSVFGCAIGMWRANRVSAATGVGPAPASDRAAHHAPVTWRRRLRWIALAAVPSSLMLGVTTYITTDVAVVPLLWVIPLAMYLLTFILVFSRRRLISHRWMVRLFPAAAIVLLLVLVSGSVSPAVLVGATHLIVFFLAAMVCHGELAADRPDPVHLTEYFLLMSVGGVVGGMFNGLLAPVVFTSIAEYGIALVAACMLMPSLNEYFPDTTMSLGRISELPGKFMDRFLARLPVAVAEYKPGIIDVIAALFVLGVTLPLVLKANLMVFTDGDVFTAGMKRLAMIGAGPAVLCYVLSERPMRFGLCMAAVLIATHFNAGQFGRVLDAERSFFGVHRVTQVHRLRPDLWLNKLFHGTTEHGKQRVDPVTKVPINPDDPLSYYHRKGPIGRVFAAYPEDRFRRVGLIGLGTGALFAYGTTGSHFTSYEIDPVVLQIAESSGFFTYMKAARERGVHAEVVLGDARQTLASADDGTFDLLVLDAFSSDAIPVHLLTVEAGELYKSKLAPGGMLMFHISNRYLNLLPVMSGLADALDMTLTSQFDSVISREQRAMEDREISHWVLLATSVDELAPLHPGATGIPWKLPETPPDFRPWTDDYSNIFEVLR